MVECKQFDWNTGLFSSWEDTATQSSILAWKIPWTEEPAGLYSPWGHKELETTEQLKIAKTVKKNISCIFVTTVNQH